jgi:hypothetical protein
MTYDELRAAWTAYATCDYSAVSGSVVQDRFREAAIAYLAEHRADDDELVTEDGLRRRDAKQVDSIAGQWIIASDWQFFDVMFFPKDRTLRLYAANLDSDGVTRSMGGCAPVKTDPTWGDVNRLLLALGIA